jgi:hypothetical protein
MTTDTNNTDLDKLFKLCHEKTFGALTPEEKQFILKHVTEEEYNIMFEVDQTMYKDRTEDITPSESVKDKLNTAWHARTSRVRPFQLRIPVSYSATAAVLFFLAGLGFSDLSKRTPKVVHDTLEVEVVKYVDRPTKEIQYIEVPAKSAPLQTSQSQSTPLPEHVKEDLKAADFNSEALRQQEITLANINLTLNETIGMSLGDDTLLQKMIASIR